MYIELIALIILFTIIMIGRFINEKAHTSLSTEQKTQLVDTFSKLKVYQFLPIVLGTGIYISLILFNASLYTKATFIFLIYIICYLLISNSVIIAKIYRLRLPRKFFALYSTSIAMTVISVLIFLYIIFTRLLHFSLF